MAFSHDKRGRGSSGHGVALFAGAVAAESANATNLQVTTQPVGSTSPNLATQPVVTAKKSFGTTDTSYVSNVVPTLNVLTGSATLGGTEASGKACVAGVCTFTNLTVTAAAGATWTITFTSGALTPAVSATATTTAGGGFTSITDAFTGTDGTAIVGRTTTTGGKTWVALQGTFQITGNQAAPLSTATGDLIVVDTGVSDGTFGVRLAANVTVTLLAFRVTDSANYWRLWYTGTILLLQTVAAGVATNRANVSITVNPGDIISATCSGNTISASVNGVQQIAPFSFTYNTTATEAGLLLSSGSASARWDDFSVTVP